MAATLISEVADIPKNLENDSINNDDAINELAKDYASYLEVDTSKEILQFDDNIEDLLTKLDEYCGLVDIIRSDTNLCLGKTLPAIHDKSKEMDCIFEKIDQLEAFVSLVKQQVLTIEQHLDQAEESMGSFGTFKKIFNSIPSFFSKRSPQPPPAVRPQKFIPPTIYKTEDYIHYSQHGRASRSPSNPPSSPSHSSSVSTPDEEGSPNKQRAQTVS